MKNAKSEITETLLRVHPSNRLSFDSQTRTGALVNG